MNIRKPHTKPRPWTPEELLMLDTPMTDAEIAAATGRTVTSVNIRRRPCRNLKCPKGFHPDGAPEPNFVRDGEDDIGPRNDLPPVFSTLASEDVTEYWKKRAKAAEKALADSRHDKTAAEIVAENILEMAPKSYSPYIAGIQAEPKVKHGSPQSAVLLFSDTHIGAVVHPEQTLDLGNYSFEIFLRRLARLERSVHSILADHTTTDVPEIVVPMLGDMLDGALVHAAECGQSNTMLEQFYGGGHAIAQFFRNLSALAPKIRIHGTVGNHTRWGHQHKMPSKNRNSNFDMLLYLYIQALVRDVPNIEWHLDWQPFARFEVQGYSFYCAHGDNVRGGDKVLGIPNHSIGRMVSTTTQLCARKKIETPAYYCLGHLHRPIELPHARGQVIVNGAFPGIDGYSLGEYFNSSWPIQKFWLMHPKFGRSATYDLRLDLGDDTSHNYTLPTQFTCK